MSTKGFIRGSVEDGFQVGAAATDSDYIGPVADVSFDDKWLHITTDDYEGAAMLNIEALPFLLKALRQIDKRRRAPPDPGGEKR